VKLRWLPDFPTKAISPGLSRITSALPLPNTESYLQNVKPLPKRFFSSSRLSFIYAKRET